MTMLFGAATPDVTQKEHKIEAEIERLQQLVAELLIKNQQLREALGKNPLPTPWRKKP